MSKRTLTHPRLLEYLPAFYPSKVVIQQATVSGTSFGTPVQTWATVSGLANIDGRIAPLTTNELKQQMFTELEATHEIALRGYYPQIVETMRALINGSGWDIKAVEHDGQGVTTRLRVNEVTL